MSVVFSEDIYSVTDQETVRNEHMVPREKMSSTLVSAK